MPLTRRIYCIWLQKHVLEYSQKYKLDNLCTTTDAVKSKQDQGYRGPAKVIAVENGQSGAPMVAWLSHAGILIRAAPEHLRMATPLKSRTYDVLSDAGLLSKKDMAGLVT